MKRLMLCSVVVMLGLVSAVAAADQWGTTPSPLNQAVFTLADDTSCRMGLHVVIDYIRDLIEAHELAQPHITGHLPGTHVAYFDHDLLTMMWTSTEERLEVEGVGALVYQLAVTFFPKPDDFEGRWPLVQTAPAGSYYVVTAEQPPSEVVPVGGSKRPRAYLVTVEDPHRLIPMRTRTPDWGVAPGAMLSEWEIIPYVTQIRDGCVFGVGLVEGEEIIACDLVR